MLRRDARRLRLVVPETRRAHRCLELGEPTRQRVGVKGITDPGELGPELRELVGDGPVVGDCHGGDRSGSAPRHPWAQPQSWSATTERGVSERTSSNPADANNRSGPVQASSSAGSPALGYASTRLTPSTDSESNAPSSSAAATSTAPPRRHEEARHRPRRRIRLRERAGTSAWRAGRGGRPGPSRWAPPLRRRETRRALPGATAPVAARGCRRRSGHPSRPRSGPTTRRSGTNRRR